jgi:hypothetical protein
VAKETEYFKSKLMLGTLGLIIGVSALAFALFGWSQAAHPLFGGYTRYMCGLGGLGAMVSGTLMMKESLTKPKLAAKPIEEPVLEFLVALEEEQTVST